MNESEIGLPLDLPKEETELKEIDDMTEKGKIELHETFFSISKKLSDIWFQFHELHRSSEPSCALNPQKFAELYNSVINLEKMLQEDTVEEVKPEKQGGEKSKTAGSTEALLRFNLLSIVKEISKNLKEIKTGDDLRRNAFISDDIYYLQGIAKFWDGR